MDKTTPIVIRVPSTQKSSMSAMTCFRQLRPCCWIPLQLNTVIPHSIRRALDRFSNRLCLWDMLSDDRY